MINPTFYNPKRAKAIYLDGKIKHYLRKPPTVTLQSRLYTVKERDTMHLLGLKVFGDENMYFWTIIADNNQIRQPDGWRPGEQINLPLVILNDVVVNKPDYELSGTSSTKIFS